MRGRSLRVALQGYYGMRNFGDDLFCQVMVDQLASHPGGFRPYILAPPDVGGQVDSLPAFLEPAWRSNNPVARLTRGVAKVATTWTSDAVLLAGGSTLSDMGGSRRVEERLGISRRKPHYAVGVSIGPFRTVSHEADIAAYLAGFREVLVRDHSSEDAAKKIGVETGFSGDIGTLYAVKPRTPDPIIGFSPCRHTRDSKDLIARIVEGMSEVASVRGCSRFRVFALNSHPINGDVELARSYASALRRNGFDVEVVSHIGDVAPVVESIASVELLLTNRLHGAVVAYQAGVPFVLGEYHVKCKDFLDDIGQPEILRARTVDRFPEVLHTLALESASTGQPAVKPEVYRGAAQQSLTGLLNAMARELA